MTTEEFIKAYEPANMWRYAVEEDRCHIGNGHTIAQAVQEFGIKAVYTVFQRLLSDFVSFNHSQQVINDAQMNELAAVIVTEFRFLKVPELILFFAKAKAGRFGKFFNSIYPMDITTQLCEWEKVCNQRQGELFHARHMAEIEEERNKMYGNSCDAVRGSIWISQHRGQEKGD